MGGALLHPLHPLHLLQEYENGRCAARSVPLAVLRSSQCYAARSGTQLTVRRLVFVGAPSTGRVTDVTDVTDVTGAPRAKAAA